LQIISKSGDELSSGEPPWKEKGKVVLTVLLVRKREGRWEKGVIRSGRRGREQLVNFYRFLRLPFPSNRRPEKDLQIWGDAFAAWARTGRGRGRTLCVGRESTGVQKNEFTLPFWVKCSRGRPQETSACSSQRLAQCEAGEKSVKGKTAGGGLGPGTGEKVPERYK